MSFSASHRIYVKSLYKRYLKQGLDWYIRRDLWRDYAIEIRAKFEANRNITNPRQLAKVLEHFEERLANRKHPDPYIPVLMPGGSKVERNAPPPMFSTEEKQQVLDTLKADKIIT
ncbi:NADH dehydrogenase 1 beta subcomplex subunit 9 [Wallemia ichthyophaga EXF-994]|uniref:NADH dehydrogenase [ubiquinone] 1 beta subcomplex subunit 9 n=1 Tax=Wallemia ichthyophaga (strain EXF-994 / CBS 113033) TaxID=1299270 RepID=R9AXR7_WALI9|nr:NADH dehydrogenase 1 beta subcomplex subunit 9 [Wallemia ichthyophaga EXF-994]EOR04896.1 NADH dehydrogenase 1 beta subcomplex subunit 9 [Wallemia ichthyophaga EXF-994]